MELIHISMGHSIKDIERMIYRMGSEEKHGEMVAYISGSMLMAGKKEMVVMNGLTVIFIPAIGRIIKFQGKGFMSGGMAEGMKGSGKIIK